MKHEGSSQIRRQVEGSPDIKAGSEWLTVAQAAERAGVSERTMRRECQAGKVRSRSTTGGHRRIRVDDLEAYLRGDSDQQQPPSARVTSRREALADLTYEIQLLRGEREREKLVEERATREAGRALEREAEAQAKAEERDRVRREHEERIRQEKEQKRHQKWIKRWHQFGLGLIPEDAPAEVRLQIFPQVKQALAELTPADPFDLPHARVQSAVRELLLPWQTSLAIVQRQAWLNEQKDFAWSSLAFAWCFGGRPSPDLRSELGVAVERAMQRLDGSSSWSELRDARSSAIDAILTPWREQKTLEERKKRTEQAIEATMQHLSPFLQELREKRYLRSDNSLMLADVLRPKVRAFLESRAKERDFEVTEGKQLLEEFVLEDQKLV